MQDTLEKDLDLLAADREALERALASFDPFGTGEAPAERDAITRSIGRIDVARRELIERSTFAIAGRGFEVLFGPGVTSLPELEALVEAAVHAMLVPRPDFHLDPSALEPDAKAEHDAAVDEWSSAQQQYLEHATEERVFALAILGCEVLRSLGKASLAEVPLRPVAAESPPAPVSADFPPWQPIETAPTDGRWLIVARPSRDARPMVDVAEHDENGWFSALRGRGRPIHPTHWMPLPPIPSSEVPG